MTLEDLKARGVMRVRRMEWAYPHQYVELTQDADGAWNPVGVLCTLADENALAMPTRREVLVETLGVLDDRWEPYPRP